MPFSEFILERTTRVSFMRPIQQKEPTRYYCRHKSTKHSSSTIQITPSFLHITLSSLISSSILNDTYNVYCTVYWTCCSIWIILDLIDLLNVYQYKRNQSITRTRWFDSNPHVQGNVLWWYQYCDANMLWWDK